MFSILLAIGSSGANAQEPNKCSTAYMAKNYRTAAKECLILAKLGDADAASRMAIMYEDGDGVVQNFTESFYWTRIAAEHGSAVDQSVLGTMYWEGKGVTADIIRGHMWVNIAAANGSISAKIYRDDYEKIMSSADIAIAQSMAQECISSGYKNCGD